VILAGPVTHDPAGARPLRNRAVHRDRRIRYVRLPGVTVAGFRQGKIRSFRMYFDDISLIEQIAGV
jgi:hypothetical protein